MCKDNSLVLLKITDMNFDMDSDLGHGILDDDNRVASAYRIGSARCNDREMRRQMDGLKYGSSLDLGQQAADLALQEVLESELAGEKGVIAWIRNHLGIGVIGAALSILGLSLIGYSQVRNMSGDTRNQVKSITLTGDPEKDAALRCADKFFKQAYGCDNESESESESACTPQMLKEMGGTVRGALNLRDAQYAPDESPDKWIKRTENGKPVCVVE